jgi:hypothetical protein
MKKSKQETKGRILKMTKTKKSDKSVSPTEVTKNLFADVWKDHVDEVRTMAGELQSEKLTNITKKGKALVLNKVKHPIQLSLLKRNE